MTQLTLLIQKDGFYMMVRIKKVVYKNQKQISVIWNFLKKLMQNLTYYCMKIITKITLSNDQNVKL